MKYKSIKSFNNSRTKAFLYWIFFWFLQSILMSGGKHVNFYLQKNIAIVSLQAIVVYINLYVLFPFLFEKKKYILYTVSSIVLIYLIFSISFFFIELIFSLSSVKSVFIGSYFSTDFWRILSGSSFYSLALVCSTLYQLLIINRKIEKENQKTETTTADQRRWKTVSTAQGVGVYKIRLFSGSKERNNIQSNRWVSQRSILLL